MKKRILSILMAAAMTLTLSATAFAADVETIDLGEEETESVQTQVRRKRLWTVITTLVSSRVPCPSPRMTEEAPKLFRRCTVRTA